MRRIFWSVLVIAITTQSAWAGPLEDALSAYDKGDNSTALRLWRPLAATGHAEAQMWLGIMYERGAGVPRSIEQAMEWYRKAADQGHAYAQYYVGDMYRGMHLSAWFSDKKQARLYEEEAASWWRKAADQGVDGAQLALAFMYDRPNEAVDYRQAAFWYRKAADRGNPIAQGALARLYEEGNGVPRDYQQAYFWLLLASAIHDSSAAARRDQIEPRLTAQERSSAQAQARIWKPMKRRDLRGLVMGW